VSEGKRCRFQLSSLEGVRSASREVLEKKSFSPEDHILCSGGIALLSVRKKGKKRQKAQHLKSYRKKSLALSLKKEVLKKVQEKKKGAGEWLLDSPTKNPWGALYSRRGKSFKTKKRGGITIPSLAREKKGGRSLPSGQGKRNHYRGEIRRSALSGREKTILLFLGRR